VTEEFLPDKLVKFERGSHLEKEAVLKLNATRNFHTGIYPYSLMTSVFTPIHTSKPTLKTSTSIQEWCGHVYAQVLRRGDGYRIQSHSYFQDAADHDLVLPAVLLEDEIWTRIRLAPEALPSGKLLVVPGAEYLRLQHKSYDPIAAEAQIVTADREMNYRITYADLQRTLSIRFEKEFPFRIQGWEESGPDGWGKKRQMLTTIARRTHSIQLDYWNHNSVSDEILRKELGLKGRQIWGYHC